MKTKTIKLYSFDELPAKSREKVIEKHSDINVDYDWWDCVYDDFAALCATIGIDVDLKKTYFTGFYHQGQGSAFTASIDVLKLIAGIERQAWKEHAPKEGFSFPEVTKNIGRVAKLIYEGHIDFNAGIEPANRETQIRVHCGYDVDFNQISRNHHSNIEQACEDLQEFIEDVATTLNKWFFRELQKESYYRQSEEAVIETIKANEYYFDLAGNIHTPDVEAKQTVFQKLKAVFTVNFFRLTALTFMWLQMLAVLAYAVVQHPVVKPFFNR